VATIERVLAPNPGPLTGPGTNTYVIVSAGEAIVLDPGPVIAEHLYAIKAELTGSKLVGILVTHNHPDHAPAAAGLGRELDVPVLGFAASRGFEPTGLLEDGEVVRFGDSEVTAIHTPGHTTDHLCFQLGGALFVGDHIMGGSTVIIENAATYMDSLHKIAALEPARLYPGHGAELPHAGSVVAEYIAHRLERERQVLRAVETGAETIGQIVDVVYADLEPSLRLAATIQVHTQLVKLRDEGRVSLGAGGAHDATVVERVENH